MAASQALESPVREPSAWDSSVSRSFDTVRTSHVQRPRSVAGTLRILTYGAVGYLLVMLCLDAQYVSEGPVWREIGRVAGSCRSRPGRLAAARGGTPLTSGDMGHTGILLLFPGGG
ncbi:hypothetical protein GCM10028793_58250 [Nocardiopsis oceani]